MNIDSINKRHFLKYNVQYRLEYDLSTKLVKYENCIMFISIHIGTNWKKTPYKTALDIARNWREVHPELKNAVGAKVYIVESQNAIEENTSELKIKYKKGILFDYWHKN